ncbi:hypothetical protein O1611_g1426 [Lasiodiplodia mahajangana]|uniref:Uncharacterized protein n=1 Tax=Lasiodiplodia mahajangana TaxID=1108764 RepID=A0ACC2JXG3_9PEZI|nr:hypothetical protein O1611_g1426 [Lasiodiplodia mahajangana]
MSLLRSVGEFVLVQWHRVLGLPRQSPRSWHQDRFNEELEELNEANDWLEKVSEASDVLFAISRAKYDGFPIADVPSLRPSNVIIYGYMLAKYTSRWAFYRTLAFLSGAPATSTVREVVNPTKDHKLENVARRHHIDPERFKSTGRRLRRIWPLFP